MIEERGENSCVSDIPRVQSMFNFLTTMINLLSQKEKHFVYLVVNYISKSGYFEPSIKHLMLAVV